MLNDPLVVAVATSLANLRANTSLGDQIEFQLNASAMDVTMRTVSEGEGTAKRKADLDSNTKIRQSISHSQSKENAPYVTDRTSIRFDEDRNDVVTGKPVTMSAYLVTALPQGGTFTEDDAVALACSLALFILAGARGTGSSPRVYDAELGDTLKRILAGEA